MKAMLCIIGCFIIVANVHAQDPAARWIYQYDHAVFSNEDKAKSIVMGVDGNIYAAGYTYTTNTRRDFTVISLTQLGEERWVYQYDHPDHRNDEALSIIAGPGGDLYAAGYSTDLATGEGLTVVRLTPSGEERWLYRSTYGFNDRANSIVTDGVHRLYAAGYGWKPGSGGCAQDFFVVCIDTLQGDPIWDYHLTRKGHDLARSIATGPDTNVHITGETEPTDADKDITVICLDKGDGTLLCEYDSPGSNPATGHSLVVDSDGYVYVAGYTTGNNEKDFTVICLEPHYSSCSYVEKWMYIHEDSRPGSDEATAIALGPDGYVYATGWCWGDGTGHDIVVVKLTPGPNGGPPAVWTDHYDREGSHDRAYSIVVGSDHTLYVAGTCEGTGDGITEDFSVISYTDAGGLRWAYHYDGPANDGDEAEAIVVGTDLNLYAAGHSVVSGSDPDFTVLSLGHCADGEATAYPNSSNLCRIPGTDDLWVTYFDEQRVYARFSADGGKHSVGKYLDEYPGEYPTIDVAPILDDPPRGSQGEPEPVTWFPIVVWQQPSPGGHLYCARHFFGQWQYADLYEHATREVHLPSMVVGLEEKVHLTWEEVLGGMRYVRYATFRTDRWPPVLEPPVPVEVASHPGTGWWMAPCIDIDNVDGWERPHIVFKREDDICYTKKMAASGFWRPAVPISAPTFFSSFPFLEIYGDRMKALWHGHDVGVDDIRYCWKRVPWDYWSGIDPISGTGTESQFPSMSAAYASWSDERYPDREEILMRKEPFQNPWVNITETADARSMYPHVKYWNRFSEPNYLYFAWTEGNGPYAVELLEYPVFTMDVPPYYYVETGQEEPSFYCVERDSFIQFGPEAYKQVDVDQNQLVYHFDGLKPWMYYLLTVTGYWEGVGPIEQRVYTDGIDKGPFNLTPGEPETLSVWIPIDAYKDDNEAYVAITKLSGEWAVVGPITLYEFEEQEGAGGGFQSATTSPLEAREFVLSQNYPNPVREGTTIRYHMPADGRLSLKIYDICGRLIRTLVDGPKKAGRYEVNWDGTDEAGGRVPSGVYFYRLNTGSYSRACKMAVLR